MTIQVKTDNTTEIKSLFSLEMKKEYLYQMAIKVERELLELRQTNEDLMADIKAYESNKRPRQKREKVGYEPGQRGLPKGVSRLDYAEWKATYGQNVPADKRPVDAYQEAIASGAWVVSVKPKVARNSSGVGRGKGEWSGRKTQDQLAAQNGGWPSRKIWTDAVSAHEASDGCRPNLNFQEFLTTMRENAKMDEESVGKLTASVFFRHNPEFLADPQDQSTK